MVKEALILSIVLTAAICGLCAHAQEAESDGIKKVLERDAIPAIFEPRFVDAAKAKIAPDALVIGVSIGGEAHCYSLSLLDHHEIVNDVVGGTAVVPTW